MSKFSAKLIKICDIICVLRIFFVTLQQENQNQDEDEETVDNHNDVGSAGCDGAAGGDQRAGGR